MENTVQVKSSAFPDKNIQHIKEGQSMFPTWLVISFLIVVMIVLKSFIYIKDPKRHGK